MRRVSVLLAILLFVGAAQAQVISPLGGSTNNPQGPPPATPGASAATSRATAPASPAAPQRRRTLAERFAAANTTRDGKLTLEQARAGRMNAVVRDFAQIDKEKRGYVTLDQVRAFQAEQRSARRAARTQKPAQ